MLEMMCVYDLPYIELIIEIRPMIVLSIARQV